MNEYARFAADLARSALGIDKEAKDAVTLVGRGALATAKKNAPVDEGTLRAGIQLRVKGTTSVVQATAYYASFQEFGTSRMAPNPFMLPAVTEWGPRLVREVEKIRDGVVEDLT